MPIKMIVLDLDNTFLHSDKSISDYSLSVLERCREQGIRIVVATARSEQEAKRYTDRMRPDGMVSNCGARVRCGDVTIARCMVPAEETASIIADAAAEKACLTITVDTDEGYFASWDEPLSADFAHAVHCEFKEPFRKASYKMTLDIPDREAAARIAGQHPGYRMTPFSDGRWYQFARSEATKMNGVRHAAAHFGISTEEAAAFGDDTSDLSMIKGCGMGVAMGNAIEAVKAAADAVCLSNDEDGAMRWVEQNIL